MTAFLFILWGYFIPQKTTIQKYLNCFEKISGENITVNISGVYYAYFLKDDCFKGTINVENKRICTMNYNLREDLYTNFVDKYGQPEGGILQFKQFSYICISDLDYYLYSEWKPEWKKEFEKKEKWNEKRNKLKKIVSDFINDK